MSDPAPLTELDERGAVRDDLSCRHCGYNLRTQSGDQPCPECGKPIADSLGKVPAEWTRIIIRGVALWIVGTVVNTATMVVQITVGALSPIAIVGYVIAPIAWLIGTWMITSAEPNRSVGKPGWLARCLAIFLLVMIEYLWVEQRLRVAFSWNGSLEWILTSRLGTVVVEAGLFLTVLWWLNRLVRRIPHPGLALALWIQFGLVAFVHAIVIGVYLVESADALLGLDLIRYLYVRPQVIRIGITYCPPLVQLNSAILLVETYRALRKRGIRR